MTEASSPFLNRPLRSTVAQAVIDLAKAKAAALEPMTYAELGLLSLGELVELADRADGAVDRLEADNIAYLKGYGPNIRRLRILGTMARVEIGRRADMLPAAE